MIVAHSLQYSVKKSSHRIDNPQMPRVNKQREQYHISQSHQEQMDPDSPTEIRSVERKKYCISNDIIIPNRFMNTRITIEEFFGSAAKCMTDYNIGTADNIVPQLSGTPTPV